MKKADHELLVGRLIAGKFVVEGLIGTGAMGAVFRARQVALEKTVAIKVMHGEHAKDPAFAGRFHREAKAASRLNHPNSIQVLDFGAEPDGLLYIAMEYLDGRSLHRVLKDEWPLAPARTADILMQVLAALAVAHDLGVVHRDLKPENVMVLNGTDDDGRPKDIVKVCDFGIAKITDPRAYRVAGERESEAPVTTAGFLVGTPEYMSPEQGRGEKLDLRSDLYSVGVILYEMLTRHVPFDAENAIGVVLKHITEEPVPPSRAVSGIDPRLEATTLRALRKFREERHASAREMRAELRPVAEAHTVASLTVPVAAAPVESVSLGNAATIAMAVVPGVTGHGSMPGVAGTGPTPGVTGNGSLPGITGSGGVASVTGAGLVPRVTSNSAVPAVTDPGAPSRATGHGSGVKPTLQGTTAAVAGPPRRHRGLMLGGVIAAALLTGAAGTALMLRRQPKASAVHTAQMGLAPPSASPAPVTPTQPVTTHHSVESETAGAGEVPSRTPGASRVQGVLGPRSKGASAILPGGKVASVAPTASAAPAASGPPSPSGAPAPAMASASSAPVAPDAPVASAAAAPATPGPSPAPDAPPPVADPTFDPDKAYVEVGMINAEGVKEHAVRGALHGMSLAQCYRSALHARAARATGVATLNLSFDETGLARSAVLTGADFLPEVARCVQDTATGMRIDHAQVDPGGGTAEVTIGFREP
jgi:eukaryotic-like serine/threonine-protein kinase